jgi:hypothetical protein
MEIVVERQQPSSGSASFHLVRFHDSKGELKFLLFSLSDTNSVFVEMCNVSIMEPTSMNLIIIKE